MTDNENGKKMVEEMELSHFLDAYRQTTGRRLSSVYANEKPDFICVWPNGKRVGIELTKANGDLGLAKWEKILDGSYRFDPFFVLDCVYAAVGAKESKWMSYRFIGDTILVLQFDCYPLSDMEGFLTVDLAKDFEESDFTEIWIADYTTVEPYGGVELFGLKPAEWWGYHPREDFSGKPYG